MFTERKDIQLKLLNNLRSQKHRIFFSTRHSQSHNISKSVPNVFYTYWDGDTTM